MSVNLTKYLKLIDAYKKTLLVHYQASPVAARRHQVADDGLHREDGAHAAVGGRCPGVPVHGEGPVVVQGPVGHVPFVVGVGVGGGEAVDAEGAVGVAQEEELVVYPRVFIQFISWPWC